MISKPVSIHSLISELKSFSFSYDEGWERGENIGTEKLWFFYGRANKIMVDFNFLKCYRETNVGCKVTVFVHRFIGNSDNNDAKRPFFSDFKQVGIDPSNGLRRSMSGNLSR